MKLRIFITIVLCAFIPFIAHAATPGMTQYNSGWEQVNIKKYKLANASFTKALKSLPNNQKWMAIDGLGWVAYFLGKDAEAEKIFSSNIKRNPNASYSYKGLAFIQLRQKMWDKAALNLEHSFKLVPKQPISDYLFAANVFISAKKYSYATIVLGQALSIYPKSADINFYLAKSLYLASDKDKAYAFLATATYYDPIRISPLFNTLKGIDLNKTKDSLLNMGWGLYVAGYYKDALFRFNQCLGVDKNNSNALRGKGFSLLSLKQYKEANKALEISMSLPGHNKLKPVTTTFVAKNKKSIAIITDTETMLAWSEYYLGDYLNSQASFEQITTNHPDWVNAQLGLAYTLKALGKDFKPTVTQVNKLAPGYTSYIPEHSSHVLEVSYKLYNSGWKNIYAKQYSKAHKDFKDAMAKFPDNLKWLASDGMAWINYYEGKNSIAKSDFDKIIKSTPRATLSYKGLSYVYLKEKQYDKAYSTVQKLFSIKSLHNADVYSYLINSFTNAEKYTYAENLLNTALYYHPKSGELLLQKAKVLWLQGKKNEAYPVLKSAIYYAPIKVNNSLNAFKGIDTGKLQDSLLHIAWGLYVNGDNKAAFKQFESFYKSSPHKEPIGLDELNAIRGQGFCLLKLEQFQQAKNKLESVLNNKDASQLKPVTTTFYSSTGISIPIYVDATTSLGWANYSLGDYKNAERNFRAVLAEYPHWVNARLGLAYTLKAAGNDSYKKEVTIVNKYAPGYGVFIPNLPANISKKAFASYNSGWVNIFAQKYDDAIEDFTNAKGEFQSADKWLADDGIAWVSYNKTNYAEALVQFSNIVRHNSKASLSYKGLAYTYIQQKNYGKAYDSATKLLSVQPLQGLDVLAYLTGAFIQAKQFHFADKLVDKGLALYPKSGDLLFYKAQVLWNKGEHSKAYKLITVAAEISPLTVDYGLNSLKGIDLNKIKGSLTDMGWGLYSIYKNEAALKRFNQFHNLSDNKKPLSVKELDAIRGQGFCYLRLQKNKEAISKLTTVIDNSKASALQPVVTYFYTTDKKSVPVHSNSRTSLAWAQNAIGEYKDAEANFRRVLVKHPSWVNPRLGLAYVLKSTDREEQAEQELNKINNIAPGYGVIPPPILVKPWTFVAKVTAGWYKPDSAKNNSQAYQIATFYTPDAHVNLGAFYAYQHINFRSASSPSKQDRAGYSFTLLQDIDNIGWFGPSGKGNYIFNSAYNDGGANNTYFPYWALTYKTPDLLTTIELGRATLNFKGGLYTKVEQNSLMISTHAIEHWLLGLTFYSEKLRRLNEPNDRLKALSVNATYYISDKHNVAGFVMFGHRQQAYGLDINTAYDIRDRQNGSVGITYSYNLNPNIGLFADLSHDRFILDSDTSKKYKAYYLTFGVVM